MKRKTILFLAVLGALLCLLAVSVSAANMTNYCTVKLTLTSGEDVTAYCMVSGDQMKRDDLYKTPDSAGEKYNWEDVVVFDCREQEIVGNGVPKTFSGTVCNSQAKNVITVYLSDYQTYFLNTTFTNGWTSLETVYISKSVTEIKGFGSSPVKNVVIPEDSQLVTIGADAFNGCTQLENIDISGCSSLKTISTNAFRNCQSLYTITFPQGLESIGRNGFYTSSISGTVVVPNSVKTLDAGAFLNTKIETLVLGDGIVTIGYNFLCDLSSSKNAYLKNVYLSDETVFTDKNIFYKSVYPVNFYIVGENCDGVRDALLSQSAAIGSSLMTFVLEEDVNDETGAGYGIIHTGYNRCVAFYGGEHIFEDAINPDSCKAICTRCQDIRGAQGEHGIFVITESFEGEKYVSSCTVVKSCSDCGYVANTTNVGKIIDWLGYSVPEEIAGETVGISQSFFIDKSALAQYEAAIEGKIDYGVVAANGTNSEPVSVLEGKGVGNGSFVISMVGVDCFEIKIGGIGADNFDTAVIFNAYVVIGAKVYYISGDKTTTTPVALSYNQIK